MVGIGQISYTQLCLKHHLKYKYIHAWYAVILAVIKY